MDDDRAAEHLAITMANIDAITRAAAAPASGSIYARLGDAALDSTPVTPAQRRKALRIIEGGIGDG